MRKAGMCGMVVAMIVVLGLAPVYGEDDYVKRVGNISISAVKKLEMVPGASQYTLKAMVVFSNKNPEAIKMTDGSFKVTFTIETPVEGDKGEKPTIRKEKHEFGFITVGDIVLPEASDSAPGTVDVPMMVILGKRDTSTVDKMVSLFNAIGNPDAQLKMNLLGSAKVWLKVDSGWVTKQNERPEVDLTFTPSVQREVVLR